MDDVLCTPGEAVAERCALEKPVRLGHGATMVNFGRLWPWARLEQGPHRGAFGLPLTCELPRAEADPACSHVVFATRAVPPLGKRSLNCLLLCSRQAATGEAALCTVARYERRRLIKGHRKVPKCDTKMLDWLLAESASLKS